MRYNLYNEDCIEVMRNMPEDSIDLVCTDPPYLIPRTTGGGTCNKAIHLSKALDNLKPLGIHKGYNIDLMAQEIDRIQGGQHQRILLLQQGTALRIPHRLCGQAQMPLRHTAVAQDQRCAYIQQQVPLRQRVHTVFPQGQGTHVPTVL